MALTSIGDLAQSLMLRRSMASTKTEIHRLTQESTTGVVSDPARHLSGDLGALSALRADLRRTEGFQTARATVQLHVDGQQTVLQRLNTRATELSASLVSAGDTGQSMTLTTMALNARAALSEAVSALNTQVAGRSLFSGKTTDRPALPSAEALLASLGAITGGLSSAADIEAAVDGWFSSTAGFASAYGGDDPIGRVAIARGQEADLNLTAEAPAIRDTLRGFALAALAQDAGLPGAERSALVSAAGQTLLNSSAARADLAAELAVTQNQIAEAEAQNSSATTALEIAQVDLIGVDDYDAATRLSAAQTRLETIYAITARMSALSLVNYLK